MEPEDRALLEKARQGDEQAWGYLLEKYRTRVTSFCSKFISKYDGAQDATQETFVRATRFLESFRGDTQVLSWLLSIATNVCLQMLRQEKQSPVALAPIKTGNPDAAEAVDPASDPARQAESQMLLQAFQSGLDERERTILTYLMLGWSRVEIGHMMGLNPNNVRFIVFRIRQKLNKIRKEWNKG